MKHGTLLEELKVFKISALMHIVIRVIFVQCHIILVTFELIEPELELRVRTIKQENGLIGMIFRFVSLICHVKCEYKVL